MASLGHVAVAIFAAPLAAPRGRSLSDVLSLSIVLTGASMLPDADVLAFLAGIPYEDPFGHRGATHSLVFALAVALLATLAAWARARSLRGMSPLRAFVVFALVGASHPLLDMLTDGGLGVALFFPFSTERLFFPWQPLPVAPIGRGLFSSYGMRVLMTELFYFSPLLILGVHLMRARFVKS